MAPDRAIVELRPFLQIQSLISVESICRHITAAFLYKLALQEKRCDATPSAI
jgi:hypothetical protein